MIPDTIFVYQNSLFSSVQQVQGKSKEVQLRDDVLRMMSLPCGCHVACCNTFQWTRATIGGKGFAAGQKFIPDLIWMG